MKVFLASLLPLVLAACDLSEQDPRPCNELVTTMTKADIRKIAETSMQLTLTSEQQAVIDLDGMIRYDLQVYKQCATCADIGNTEDYCTGYASDATLSSALYVPVLPNGTQAVEMNGIVNFQGAIVNVLDAPTELLPRNVSDYLATTDAQAVAIKFSNLFYSILAASSGAVLMDVDGVGYGASDCYNRTVMLQASSRQAGAVAVQGTQQFLECNSVRLSNRMVVAGFSLGSYEGLVASDALYKLGVEVTNFYSVGAPFSPLHQLVFAVETVDQNLITPATDNQLMPGIAPLLNFVYSQDYSGAAEEPLLSPEYEDDVTSWFAAGQPPITVFEVLAQMPRPPTLIISDKFLSQVRSSLETDLPENAQPCLNDEGALCTALQENNAQPLLMNVEFPVSVCHSADDTLVPITHIPPGLDNPMVTMYDSQIFPSVGDHFLSGILCAFGGIVSDFGAADPTDPVSVNYVKAIEVDDCVEPTSAPTDSPVAAPVEAPTSGGSSSAMTLSVWALMAVGPLLSGL